LGPLIKENPIGTRGCFRGGLEDDDDIQSMTMKKYCG
jgi:hypothetical protein